MTNLAEWAVITEDQRLCSNHLLLLICDETIKITDDKDVKNRRKGQYLAHCKALGIKSTEVWPLSKIVRTWWSEEELKKDLSVNEGIYKLLMMFSKNHISCPFTIEDSTWFSDKKTVKPDYEDFEKNSQQMITSFIHDESSKYSTENENRIITKIIRELNKLSSDGFDLDKDIFSARHELMRRDWTLFKGVCKAALFGGAAAAVLGPFAGGLIGNIAGLHGAAAVSYGLAFLGGGSLAAGGFGMAGGSVLIALGAGTFKGITSIKPGEIDMLTLMQAEINLPIYLAIGRIFSEDLKQESVANEIHSLIKCSFNESKSRLQSLPDNDTNEQRITTLKSTTDIYERAFDMSKKYDWISTYDVYRGMKEAI